MPASTLPPLPAALPTTQAEWEQLTTVMRTWQQVLLPLLTLISAPPATSATAGTSGAPPAQVAGYLSISLQDGSTVKVPVYKP